MGKRSQLPLANVRKPFCGYYTEKNPPRPFHGAIRSVSRRCIAGETRFLTGGRERLGKGSKSADESVKRIAHLEKELGRRAQVTGESRASREAGLHRQNMQRKLRQLGITAQDFR